MRFSRDREGPPSNPSQDRSRRRAKFVHEVKAAIRAATNDADLTLAALAKAMGKDKGSVSRALGSDTNIEIFTMFEFSEALGKEWKLSLVDREQDLGATVAGVSKGAERPTAPEPRPIHAARTRPS